MSGLFAALLFLFAPPDAAEAVVGHPAVLRPVMEPAARCSAAPQLVVALTAFTPPRDGHVSLVVSLRAGGGRRTELGQVGVFPEQAFAVPLAQAKRFGFAVPRAMLAGPSQVEVAMTVDGGNGSGARAVIGEARITPAPQDRC